MLKAAIAGKSFEDAGVPDTPDNRRVFAGIAAEIAQAPPGTSSRSRSIGHRGAVVIAARPARGRGRSCGAVTWRRPGPPADHVALAVASPEVEQLAAKIQHGLAADPEAAIPALAESARAAKAVLADWPQLGVIKACFEAGPGGCEFCNEYGFEHVTEAEEVPEWVTAAEAAWRRPARSWTRSSWHCRPSGRLRGRPWLSRDLVNEDVAAS